MPLVVDDSTSVFRHLEWDSKHFEIPVAEIATDDITDNELRQELATARAAGYGLVYWQASPGRNVGNLLDEFGGLFVNHRVTFQRNLTPVDDVTNFCFKDRSFQIALLPRGRAPAWLTELAMTAGHCSRFSVDHRLPPQKFRDLYHAWAERSARGELADRVWFAVDSSDSDRPAGFVTGSEAGGLGQIGLIAVSKHARGRGIASALMVQVHAWLLRDRNAHQVSVVTQLENESSCQLYSRCGYQLRETRRCYHFLLSAFQNTPLSPETDIRSQDANRELSHSPPRAA